MRPTRKRSTPPTPTRSLRTGSRSHTTERSGGGSGKRPKGARGATPWTPPPGGPRWETGNWSNSACRPPGPFSLPARRDNRMTPPVDLRSDTVTLPSPGMRKAMARAKVGDSQRGEDACVRALEEYAASLFGKEAGLFVPSGTMANLVSVGSWTRPGDIVIASAASHIAGREAPGSSNLASVAILGIDAPGGTFTGPTGAA